MERWLKKRKRSERNGSEQTPTVADTTTKDVESHDRGADGGANETMKSNDIGEYLGKPYGEDQQYEILKNRWIPDELYVFPKSGKRNLKFQRRWLLEFPWLGYSEKLDGAFCRFCFFFSPKEVGKGSHAPPKALVSQPFNRWKDAKEIFREHQKLEYHETAKIKAANFMTVYENKIPDVSLQLDTAKKLAIERNRKIISSLIETNLFLGRQELALRGHRDFGPISIEPPAENDGNFRALLRFRVASGDEYLRKHLFEDSSSRSTYVSPQIQNELIEICSDVIISKVVASVNESRCFSILADETTDISGIEQFSLCARYVERTDNGMNLREDFLTFVLVQDVTGAGLSEKLLATCQTLNLNLDFLRGQGYDGAAAMSGKFQGCAARISEKYPQALYVHCASHTLNLVVGDACSVPIIRNALGTIKELITFFRISAKRQTILQDAVSELENIVRKKSLTKLCETRWTEKLDAVITFYQFFGPIFSSLDTIQETGDNESSKKAYTFQQSLKSSPFIVALVVIQEFFAMAHTLSEYLQGKNIDLASATNMADELAKLFMEIRSNTEPKFHELFQKATSLAKEIDEEIKMPRITKKQTQRANYQVETVEDYYRRAVFIPFADHFITQLHDRFVNHKKTISRLQNLIPVTLIKLDENDIQQTAEDLSSQWPDDMTSGETVFAKEIELWKRFNINREPNHRPRSFIEALNYCCEAEMFPQVYNFLKIGATLAVTVATVERTFSTLKRVKTYLRNTTGESRLSGLAQMCINRDIPITTQEVLEIFVKRPRRLNLL